MVWPYHPYIGTLSSGKVLGIEGVRLCINAGDSVFDGPAPIRVGIPNMGDVPERASRHGFGNTAYFTISHFWPFHLSYTGKLLTSKAAQETLRLTSKTFLTRGVLLVKRFVLLEKHLAINPDIEGLAERIKLRRAGMGIREAALEVGVSPATLSRVENAKVPDLDTFGKICHWLGDDPAIYLGLQATSSTEHRAQVHFKKGAAISKDSAKALSEMILLAQKALMEEEL